MTSPIIAVLGTPKSGISILGQCLRMLGLTSMDDQAKTDISTIHGLLFQDLDHSPTMAGPLPQGWMQAPGAERAMQRINALIADCRNETDSLFLADPFLCRFMPLWAESFQEAGLSPKFVLMVRHPWEAAPSLARVENIDPAKAHLLWLAHVRDALRAFQDQGHVLITFDQLLADPVSALVRMGTELDLTWPNDPWSVSSSLLDFVQPNLKRHHVSNQPDKDKQKFHAYERLYQEIRRGQWAGMAEGNPVELRQLQNPNAILPTAKGIMSIQSPTEAEPGLIDSLLDVVGQYEKQSAGLQVVKERTVTELGPPLFAQVVFPSTRKGGETVETIPLIVDGWQHIVLSVPEPTLLKDKPIILKPLNTNGTVKISTINLINRATGKRLWSAKTVMDFFHLIIEGAAIRLPDKEMLSLLVTGFDSRVVLPRAQAISDNPMQFEMWLKAGKNQEIVNRNFTYAPIANKAVIDTQETLPTLNYKRRLQTTTFDYPFIICTHHKAGTAFLVKSFKKIAQEFNKKLWMKFYEPYDYPDDWVICIHQHSRVSDILSRQNFRGWHCVRHPKALILSAALYHQKCKEPWVDVPLDGFSSHTFWAASDGKLYNKIKDPQLPAKEKQRMMNTEYTGRTPTGFIHYPSSYQMHGKTYRKFLSDLPTIKEKVLFEMRSYSRGVINDMINFPTDKRFFMIQFESISFDHTMNSLRAAFSHLGFEGNDLMKCLDIAADNCLWNVGKETIKKHATTGMSDDWKDIFTGEVEKEYRRLFGWAEEALGYC